MLFVQDSRIALRLFRRTPLATGVALASFALSVGAASVVYAAIKSVDAAIVNDFVAKRLWPGQTPSANASASTARPRILTIGSA